ncbi:MAG: ribonucleoside-diphosphate reductase, adenosylcobalamin-dependent, partial [Thaumarchaeota archaeon]
MTTAIEERGDGPNLPEQKRAQVVIPPETLAAFGGDELRARVFYEKYALRDVSGKQIERTPSQMWHRVASELASVEGEEGTRREWASKFYWLLEDYRFVPGGRILFGAGQPRNATLLNCYFFGIREDSIEAIFDFCKEAARTYSYGGGVGTDISVLRPKGSPVNNAAIFSSGAVSFMELLSTTTGTIGQAGRRGAQMITIRVDHPDVIDFINVKKDLKKVNYANISVKITDAFMRAVERDEDFELKFKNEKVELNRKVRAREIWKQLVKGAWESDEPGVIFWDTIKRESTTEYNQMEVEGVNPCSEQTLENYGNCCLGSVNLSAFVQEPFTDHSIVDWDSLVRATQYAVRFLDDVLDYNAERHPLPQQKKASLWSRRIGVGITGLGDMLIKLGLKYDEDATIEFVDKLFERVTNVIYGYSTELAKEK